MMIVATATHKTKNMFFFLAQTEQGDIFKITLTHDADMGMVRETGEGLYPSQSRADKNECSNLILSGNGNSLEVLRYGTSSLGHVCSSNWFPLHCIRVRQSVSDSSSRSCSFNSDDALLVAISIKLFNSATMMKNQSSAPRKDWKKKTPFFSSPVN